MYNFLKQRTHQRIESKANIQQTGNSGIYNDLKIAATMRRVCVGWGGEVCIYIAQLGMSDLSIMDGERGR
jgi:hypothetical protein